jgi:hypothetical protein
MKSKQSGLNARRFCRLPQVGNKAQTARNQPFRC